ncbi:MAG TPA: kinase [Sphingomonadaceae bacterium]|nr:kinase [Sphingomonadaceae bacterium]
MTGDASLDAFAAELGLPIPFPPLPLYRRIAAALALRARAKGGPIVVGLCGSQGSGKSTMAAFLARLLNEDGLPTAILSLDDLYLDPEQRPVAIHPLFATRGVPGTHDVALGMTTIDRLFAACPGETVPIPRFDKARDRRYPESAWDPFVGPARIVLFEGWCVGVPPQPAEALAVPINALEADEDRDGRWRRHVNACLAGDYRALFGRIDRLVYLRAPDFDCVFAWRRRQEEKLRARVGGGAEGLMDEAALRRFIQHYERLTRFALDTLPARADIVVALDPAQGLSLERLSPAPETD